MLPMPTLERLCSIYGMVRKLPTGRWLSSRQIGEHLVVSPHSIRKDISRLGELGPSPAGYPVDGLRRLIESSLDLHVPRGVCVVGLREIGKALLRNGENFADSGYPILAGFDASINRLELIKTDIPLFPLYKLAETVRVLKISLAILATQVEITEETAERLARTDVKGIINLTPVFISPPRKDLLIMNRDVIGQVRFLSALVYTRGRSVP